jgi:hypothetical protein
LFQLFSQPLPGFVMLSGGTVTVAAGTKNGNRSQAVVTTEDHTAAFRGSTSLDCPDDFAVIGRQMGILFQVMVSGVPEDLNDGSQIRLLS